MQAHGAGSCAINEPVTLPCGSEIMLPSGVVVQLPMSNVSWDRSMGGLCTRSEDRPIERNVLHSFADQIRDKGTFGAVCDTVKRNPVLLLPGGSLVMAASAILGGDPPMDTNVNVDACTAACAGNAASSAIASGGSDCSPTTWARLNFAGEAAPAFDISSALADSGDAVATSDFRTPAQTDRPDLLGIVCARSDGGKVEDLTQVVETVDLLDLGF
eukprot:CAMPEP_0194502064 /NCGR_PEP_ID=MMETSP0253-20130528/24298_1 /TAXON_ID=2966 /ORGANISM="Noctiluca scintillans" /LENGTH=214 /DNA_ID=CAMNT_0039344149 /DNA_START=97 /DNA_END=741 /DNA_ORIENTATION=-